MTLLHASERPQTAPAENNPELGDRCHPMFRNAPSTVRFNKLRKRLLRQTREALDDFAMVTPGKLRPRWLVALSGGKDSYGLLALLLDLRWRGLLPVDLLACNLDQGQPNFPKHILPDFLKDLGVPHRIEYRDTYSIVTEKLPETSTYCALCSRLRRGASLPHCPRGVLPGAGAGPSPRGYPGDLLHEPAACRTAGGDAAETAQ